ncbi:hypothetical protein M406DRAFT_71510 [Cryphonectria parasitica EP155]|uniref:Uncharacterized protein n=1 Tax=Cryphonectria parasitica (strain ATCC 38755 / EP155) TaxID=660469 RepID=A0A9P5CRQ8_CRYP1|nr:uncharacterized protein M406DRAFT_71510 [Cryphonectria parasitica EP155]KAF3768513.1 hypothetical protein M406DRAFT_71510 [Cryphonectria parasitica EP155]
MHSASQSTESSAAQLCGADTHLPSNNFSVLSYNKARDGVLIPTTRASHTYSIADGAGCKRRGRENEAYDAQGGAEGGGSSQPRKRARAKNYIDGTPNSQLPVKYDAITPADVMLDSAGGWAGDGAKPAGVHHVSGSSSSSDIEMLSSEAVVEQYSGFLQGTQYRDFAYEYTNPQIGTPLPGHQPLAEAAATTMHAGSPQSMCNHSLLLSQVGTPLPLPPPTTVQQIRFSCPAPSPFRYPWDTGIPTPRFGDDRRLLNRVNCFDTPPGTPLQDIAAAASHGERAWDKMVGCKCDMYDEDCAMVDGLFDTEHDCEMACQEEVDLRDVDINMDGGDKDIDMLL